MREHRELETYECTSECYETAIQVDEKPFRSTGFYLESKCFQHQGQEWLLFSTKCHLNGQRVLTMQGSTSVHLCIRFDVFIAHEGFRHSNNSLRSRLQTGTCNFNLQQRWTVNWVVSVTLGAFLLVGWYIQALIRFCGLYQTNSEALTHKAKKVQTGWKQGWKQCKNGDVSSAGRLQTYVSVWRSSEHLWILAFFSGDALPALQWSHFQLQLVWFCLWFLSSLTENLFCWVEIKALAALAVDLGSLSVCNLGAVLSVCSI